MVEESKELITDEKIEEAGSIPELWMIRSKKRSQEISQSRSWMDCVPGYLACPYLPLQVPAEQIQPDSVAGDTEKGWTPAPNKACSIG